MASKKETKLILKKDLVIPAGTVFTHHKGVTVEHGPDNYAGTFGLTDDTYGSVVYCFDWGISAEQLKTLGEYFGMVRPGQTTTEDFDKTLLAEENDS